MPAILTELLTLFGGSLSSYLPTIIQYFVNQALGAGGSGEIATLQGYGRRDLQQVLNVLGESLTVDGSVGPLTQAALKRQMTNFGVAGANQTTLIDALGLVLGFTPL